MKLLNTTQIEQVSGGRFSDLMHEMHEGAVTGWNKPVASTQMPYPYNFAERMQRIGNAFEGAWRAFTKHFVTTLPATLSAK